MQVKTCDCGHASHEHSYTCSDGRWGRFECHAERCECARFCDEKIAALVDLGNAAQKALHKASPYEVELTLRNVLGDEFFSSDHVAVVRRDDGLWLQFGPHAIVSLDAALAGRGPIVAANARAFCQACERSEISGSWSASTSVYF